MVNPPRALGELGIIFLENKSHPDGHIISIHCSHQSEEKIKVIFDVVASKKVYKWNTLLDPTSYLLTNLCRRFGSSNTSLFPGYKKIQQWFSYITKTVFL